MSVVAVVWMMLALGFAGVAAAMVAVWRQRMRESLPAYPVVQPFVKVGETRHDHVPDRGVGAAARRTPRAA
jgi:hypothetical protein